MAYADADLSTEKVVDVNVNNVEETKTEEVADITENVIDHNLVDNLSPNSTAVVQAASHEAPEPVQPHPAVQAAQQHSGQLSAQARPWPHCAECSGHVRDVFCPDQFSLSHHPTNANCVEKHADPEEL